MKILIFKLEFEFWWLIRGMEFMTKYQISAQYL